MLSDRDAGRNAVNAARQCCKVMLLTSAWRAHPAAGSSSLPQPGAAAGLFTSLVLALNPLDSWG